MGRRIAEDAAAPAPGTAASPPELPAYRDANVLRWAGAYTASAVGDGVYYLALSWAAVRGGSPAEAGAAVAVSAVPRALLMLGGGVVADRVGPRRVVIGSDAARAVTVLGLAALLLAADPGLWLLAAVAVVFGALDALFMPAVGALPPRIAPPGQLARIQGMRGLATRLATVVGAPLGGLAIAVGGPVAAFGAAGLLFALSVPLLLAVRLSPLPVDTSAPAPATLTTPLRDLVDGLRHIRRHRVLGPLLAVIGLSDLGFVGPMNIGLVLLADERGWGAAGMGWILAGFAVGSGAASLLLTVRGRVPRAGLVQGLAIVVGSAAVAALAVAPNAAAAAAVAVVIGLLTGLNGVLCNALLQTQSDPAHLGRVTSVATLLSLGLAPLSFPVTGAAIALWGTVPVFAVSAAICAAGGVYGLLRTPLRRADLPR
ncbi:MFS transporter [Streptomyces sp. HNM0663]|uniref:MFS transporter n=1 Tax=Streptomyces chengmaiensis TaxID=3040919 RepID=A0ABT6HMJ0_9ACTN|nr:MFS transporter [Streptomyces chengmaiensis]MDH2389940.1 MFS transporter [Streptomyces chengmaiensis]